MMIYHLLASASTGAMLGFAAVIVTVVAAGVCFSMIAYALETQYNEIAREVLRLGHRALGELETARADMLRLAAKFDAGEKPDSSDPAIKEVGEAISGSSAPQCAGLGRASALLRGCSSKLSGRSSPTGETQRTGVHNVRGAAK